MDGKIQKRRRGTGNQPNVFLGFRTDVFSCFSWVFRVILGKYLKPAILTHHTNTLSNHTFTHTEKRPSVALFHTSIANA
jgi:hypothetical protein